MLKEALIEIYERDLKKLKNEINLYADEAKLWETSGEIPNSAGNLCLHLIGNLNHFVGAILGKSGYVRNRDLEFSDKGVSRDELNKMLDEMTETVKSSLEKLSTEDFERDFPVAKHEEIVKTDYMLLHLLTHLEYHLGQINYHRRLLG